MTAEFLYPITFKDVIDLFATICQRYFLKYLLFSSTRSSERQTTQRIVKSILGNLVLTTELKT